MRWCTRSRHAASRRGGEAQLAYAESAVAAGMIMKRLGPNLPAFLQGLESTDSVDAGLVSFGFTTADLERSLRAQMRK